MLPQASYGDGGKISAVDPILIVIISNPHFPLFPCLLSYPLRQVLTEQLSHHSHELIHMLYVKIMES